MAQEQTISKESPTIQREHDIESGDTVETTTTDGPSGVGPEAGPEALVRSDTRWIEFLRVFLIGLLLLVAVGISTTTYKVLTHFEHESFRTEFDTVATRMAHSFIQDMRFKIWVSRFVTLAISKKAGSSSNLDANPDFIDELSVGVGDFAYWNRLGFSPLLWTESERQRWEEYARQKAETLHHNANICHVCGQGMEVGSPDNVVNLPNYGSLQCGLVAKGGLVGNILPRFCPLMPNLLKVPCNCHPVVAASNASSFGEIESGISSVIYRIKDGRRVKDDELPPFSPVWESSPLPSQEALLYNQMSDPVHRQAILAMIETKLPTLSQTTYPDGEYQRVLDETYHLPQATIYYPVFDQNSTGSQSVIGSIAMDFSWTLAFGFGHNLPLKSNGILFVIESSMGQLFSFEISNDVVTFVGEGDHHDPEYDTMMKGSSFDEFRRAIFAASPNNPSSAHVPETALVYKIRIYSSATFKGQFVTHKPVYYTTVVVFIFVFTSSLFIVYDIFVRRRQRKVMQSAMQSNAVVSSVFPEFIATRLMAYTARKSNIPSSSLPLETPKSQLRTLLGRSEAIEKVTLTNSDPIADHFPDVTVIFADIAGFTAWSSGREPVQVFQLLETVYQTFDRIAIKHGVFKIETIGDCYVAVTGLPVPQTDHAVRMARFAYEIILHMKEMAASLEALLGPGTSSLSIRVGLNSGPVTAGVLRGDKARFQLFGDTMNTTARMQTTGLITKIHASESTASLLKEAGYSKWVGKRIEKVHAKGKGDMQTYWIDLAWFTRSQEAKNLPSLIVGTPSLTHIEVMAKYPEVGSFAIKGATDDDFDSLVNWNADLLEKFLKKVVAARGNTKQCHGRHKFTQVDRSLSLGWTHPIIKDAAKGIPKSEYCDEGKNHKAHQPLPVELDDAVRFQLRHYVHRIAVMYRNNPFHNFEHASHVAMSASKIIERIINQDRVDQQEESIASRDQKKAVTEQIHNISFVISSDFLMQFAIIFSAVVHDVGHTGVSNAQLVTEKRRVALEHNNKSVAEQHSIQTAWNLFMEDQFSALRESICTTSEEMSRFQQIVVNAVLATDIADGESQTSRQSRWYRAFYEAKGISCCLDDEVSSKVTAVCECIIQASDVFHTMQHWHGYIKWNERLFEERHIAYKAGREENDPSLAWFDGELRFFDNYVIPLARKLETCGIFGVTSDNEYEYLNYAIANRHEWEQRGREIVQKLKENIYKAQRGFE